MSATGCQSVLFHFSQAGKVYRAGLDWSFEGSPAEFRGLSESPGVYTTPNGDEIVPLRTGVRPQGALILRGSHLSTQTLEAIGGLVSVSLDRARALEAVTHEALVREGERFRSSILDTITRDLQTPLASIKNAIGSLLTSDLSAQESRKLLTLAEEDSERLDRVVSETVELARFDTQQESVEARLADLKELVQIAMDSASEALLGRRVTLRFPASLPAVLVDAAMVQKVLGHLIENAATYSEATEPIFISAERDGENVSCSIADRGIGISKEEQTLIFGRMYKLRERKPARSSSGTSLAVCRAIMQAHHGSITVTSQPGRGSVFTLLFPLA